MAVGENAHVVHDVLTAHLQDLSEIMRRINREASELHRKLDALNVQLERTQREEEVIVSHLKTLEVPDGEVHGG